MSNPVTTIDERFSQGGVGPTTWDDTRDAIASAELFFLTTVRANSRPHVTPLVAVWFRDALYFCAGADEQKVVNLRHNDRVILTTGRNEWNAGLDIVVEGTASREMSHETLTHVAEIWTHKWDGRWKYAVGTDCFHHRNGDSVMEEEIWVYCVSPTKVFAFSEGTFSQTRHQF